MSDHDVTHREIYDRLVAVETKVDNLTSSTKNVTEAFAAAQGAFTVLEWIAKAAKPFLFIAAVVASISVFIQEFKAH
jgi:hypothetical protein